MRSWRRAGYRAIRPVLFAADPERVHDATLGALAVAGRTGPGRALCRFAAGSSSSAPVEVLGLQFRNRVGIGAGFDKDGHAVAGWAALGVGFVELGTVTPRAQRGNDRPRLFRVPRDEALINRMGFNNAGADALSRRLARARAALPADFIVGVNVGRNRDTAAEAAVDDYVSAAATVAPVADYVVVNVSSPNTPGVRDLGRADRVRAVVEAVVEATAGRPVLAKLSPDLHPTERDHALDAVGDAGARGVILSNTTTLRPPVRGADRSVPAGLSGRPLLPRTLAGVARARARLGDTLVLIASGGISSAADARSACDAGADLVQLWTGLVYAGPGLIGECIRATR
jgi:dihydroorotate dehydrogenase